jgi:hypothetical protein
MYLMIVNQQILGADDLSSLLQILGEVYGKAHFSIREYVIQARLTGNDEAKPLVAMLHKQYPTTLIVLPVLPPAFQHLPANEG